MRRTAFTLLELLLVLAIIIIISGIGVASYQRQYERAKFKSGVLQIQIDLNRARLLSMQSGQAYIFRYVPGSGYYEIAPLRTLQETLYRISGDFGEDSEGALTTTGGYTSGSMGGSLTGAGGYEPMSGATGAYASASGMSGGSISGSSNLLGMTQYTDDLFSAANISADLAAYARTNQHMNNLIADANNSSTLGGNGLGGSLNGSTLTGYGATPTGLNPNAQLAQSYANQNYANQNYAAQDYSTQNYSMQNYADPTAALGGYGVDPTSYGATGAIDPTTGMPVSALGGAVAMNGVGFYSDVPPNSVRDLTIQEQPLAKENALAWRVNGDGLIVRKQLEGEAIFTFLRVSASTRANLSMNRPRGVKGNDAESDALDAEGEDLGSTLGGSLRSVPKKSASSSSALGGGLDETPGQTTDMYDPSFMAQDELVVQSIWSEPIVFYPDGKTSNAVLGFASLGKTTYYSEIALRGMTGVARISSITALEPGENPAASALTQEQLFRLANPYYDMQAAQAEAQGLATSGTTNASGGALGAGDGMTANDPYGLGMQTDSIGALGAANDPLMTGDMPTTPNVNYGSSERRTGYFFNETGGNAQNMPGGDMNAQNANAQNMTQNANAGMNMQDANSFGANVPNMNQGMDQNMNAQVGGASGVDPFAAVDSAMAQPSGGALGGDAGAGSDGALGGSVDEPTNTNGANASGAAQNRRQTNRNEIMNLGSGGAL